MIAVATRLKFEKFLTFPKKIAQLEDDTNSYTSIPTIAPSNYPNYFLVADTFNGLKLINFHKRVSISVYRSEEENYCIYGVVELKKATSGLERQAVIWEADFSKNNVSNWLRLVEYNSQGPVKAYPRVGIDEETKCWPMTDIVELKTGNVLASKSRMENVYEFVVRDTKCPYPLQLLHNFELPGKLQAMTILNEYNDKIIIAYFDRTIRLHTPPWDGFKEITSIEVDAFPCRILWIPPENMLLIQEHQKAINIIRLLDVDGFTFTKNLGMEVDAEASKKMEIRGWVSYSAIDKRAAEFGKPAVLLFDSHSEAFHLCRVLKSTHF